MIFDINAPIVAASSLGNVRVGGQLSNYQGLLKFYAQNGELSFHKLNDFTGKYQIESFPIEIFVNVETDLIYKISALLGYKGKYRDSISVGQTAGEIMTIDGSLYYDEMYESVLSKEEEGVVFEFSEDEPWTEETDIKNLVIKYITVFNPEIVF